MSKWPMQNNADSFYGNPRGINGKGSPSWAKENLKTIIPPFAMTFDGHPVKKITMHKKCSASLSRVLSQIWSSANREQSQIDGWGASIFGGSFNYRLKKSGSTLSMHAYGCAIDLDPVNHPFGKSGNPFVSQVVEAFTAEGWVNLAHDQMHFQAALI